MAHRCSLTPHGFQFRCESAQETMRSGEQLNWNHERSTPHTSETHGIAEGAVRRVKEGILSVLVLSGLRWTLFFKKKKVFVFPCRKSEVLQDGQPLFNAVFQARGDPRDPKAII